MNQKFFASFLQKRSAFFPLFTSMLLIASTPLKFDVAKLVAPSDKLVLHGSDLRQVRVFEWERDGTRYNAWPDDGQTPPYDAADLLLRVFAFPGGMVRELYYKQGTRTPPHRNMEDIVMYGLSGRRVQIVDTDVGMLGAGDVSFHPVGVVHHSESVVGGSQLEFAFPGAAAPHPRAAWFSSGDVIAKPVDTGRYTEKAFVFPRVSLTETHLPKSVSTATQTPAGDILFYIVKGRVRVTLGTLSEEAGAGDAVRDPAGVPRRFAALEDTVLVQVAKPSAVGH